MKMRLFKPNIEKLKARKNIKGLINILKYKDEDVRMAATVALGELREGIAVEPIIRVAVDYYFYDGKTRETAIKTLTKLGKVSVPYLITALENGDEMEVRWVAAKVLGEIHSTEVIEPLKKALLKDRYGIVREMAAKSLIKIGELDRVIKVLKNTKNDGLRKSVIEVLGEIKDKKVVEPLINVLGDKDNQLREKAAKVLRNFNDDEAKKTLEIYDMEEYKRRIKNLDYVVGRHLLKKELYKQQIGTEVVGYFDPLKVIFRLFDEKGRRLYSRGGGETALVWPPKCNSEKESTKFNFNGTKLAVNLGALPGEVSSAQAFSYASSQPLGDMGKLFLNLRIVNEGEVDKFIHESTVLPFFYRYSGEKVVVINEVAEEVRLNALFNFLCSEVVSFSEDIDVSELRRRAIKQVNQLRKSGEIQDIWSELGLSLKNI